jgi:hypothetical protein
MASVNAIAPPDDGECFLLLHLPLPQKEVLDEDLLLLDADNDVVHKDRCAAGSGWSSQELPRLPLFIPTTSMMTPEGCMGGGGSWGEASSLLPLSSLTACSALE